MIAVYKGRKGSGIREEEKISKHARMGGDCHFTGVCLEVAETAAGGQRKPGTILRLKKVRGKRRLNDVLIRKG